MTYRVTEATFAKDVADHRLSILRDDGVHRHLRLAHPDHGNMRFDIVTYPHFLVYSGDMGCYVFSRINDMFQFFRSKESGPLRINLGYWAEKLEATDKPHGHKQYNPDLLREYVTEWLNECEADEELRERVDEEILSYTDDGEVRARDALCGFQLEGRTPFQDSWECEFDEYTGRFIWCCYALVWAIRMYDSAKDSALDVT
jgi:hypothetical protein